MVIAITGRSSITRKKKKRIPRCKEKQANETNPSLNYTQTSESKRNKYFKRIGSHKSRWNDSIIETFNSLRTWHQEISPIIHLLP